MSETTNYNLYLTDNSSENFLDWRDKINGKDNSNMIKIDNALAEKADCSQVINLTLFADAWVEKSQTVTVEGLTAEQNGFISAAPNITTDQKDAVRLAGIGVSNQQNGSITVSAEGAVPQIDIPAVIILIG